MIFVEDVASISWINALFVCFIALIEIGRYRKRKFEKMQTRILFFYSFIFLVRKCVYWESVFKSVPVICCCFTCWLLIFHSFSLASDFSILWCGMSCFYAIWFCLVCLSATCCCWCGLFLLCVVVGWYCVVVDVGCCCCVVLLKEEMRKKNWWLSLIIEHGVN